MNKAWENIEKAREVWPPNILKMLEYYDKAIEERHDYALTYKDRARLFFVLGDMQKSEENYQLWRKVEEENGQRGNSDKKLIKMVDDSITNELRIRKKGSFHKIHPWEKLKEYYESHPGPEILKEPNNEINSEKEMVRKKDTLIEEAKKIKEELNEIRNIYREIKKFHNQNL